MTCRRVPQGHPKGESLPLHPTSKFSICPPNRIIGFGKQSRPNRICEGWDECGPAFKAGKGILLDRERMELSSDPVILVEPGLVVFKFSTKLRLPESNVTGAPDPIDHNQSGTLLAQV